MDHDGRGGYMQARAARRVPPPAAGRAPLRLRSRPNARRTGGAPVSPPAAPRPLLAAQIDQEPGTVPPPLRHRRPLDGVSDGAHFTAFNMVSGSFGQDFSTQRVDSICVQSMDGKLSFFEQQKYMFTRQPPLAAPRPRVLGADGHVCDVQLADGARVVRARAPPPRTPNRDETAATTAGGGAAAAERSSRRTGRTTSARTRSTSRSRCRARRLVGGLDIVVLGEHTMFCLSEAGKLGRRSGWGTSLPASARTARRWRGGATAGTGRRT